MIKRKIIIKADKDTQVVLAFISFFGFFLFLLVVAHVNRHQEHYWDVRKAQRSCESDFQNQTDLVKNLNYSDCDLIGTQLTAYEIAKEIDYCYENCSDIKKKYLYWQEWEASCRNQTYANELCHQVTDIMLNHYHF